MEFILSMAAAVLVGVLVAWWHGRRAARARAELRDGGATSIPVRLSLEDGRPRPGRLLLGGGRATWAARRGGRRVDLRGAQLLSAAQDTGWNSGPDAVVVRLRLRSGGTAAAVLDADLADVLADVLTDDLVSPAGLESAGAAAADGMPADAPARRPGRAWWGWLLVAAGLLWTAYCACMFLTGYSATATVTSGDRDPADGFCPVVWEDPSQVVRYGEADCDDDPTGTPLQVHVTGWPEPGDPTTPGLYLWIELVVGGPTLAGGAWRLLHLRARRREDAALAVALTGPAPTAAAPPPPLTEGALVAQLGEQPQAVLSRLAPYADRQVPRDGWSADERPSGARTPVPATRFLQRVWVPLLLAGLVVVVSWPWPLRWFALHTSETASVVGTSTGAVPVESLGPLPGELTVVFPLEDGTEQRADVATDAERPEGTEVRVEHAVDSPSWARVVGDDDALGRGTALTTGAVALCLSVAGWRVRTLARWRARVRRAASAAPRPALGLLTADPAGDPLLLVTDPVVTPLRFTAVPLARPLPRGTAARTRPGAPLSVHGELRDGAVVVVRVPGVDQPLLPTGPAALVPPAGLLYLLDPAHALLDEVDADAVTGPRD